MTTITYSYDLAQIVFQVDKNVGVREGVVKQVEIKVTIAGTTILYTIQFVNTSLGSIIATENTVFADVDSALAAYRPLVLV